MSSRHIVTFRSVLLAALLPAFLAMPLNSSARGGNEGHDHDRARAALLAGEILPLPTIAVQARSGRRFCKFARDSGIKSVIHEDLIHIATCTHPVS